MCHGVRWRGIKLKTWDKTDGAGFPSCAAGIKISPPRMSHPAPEGGKSSFRSGLLTVKMSAPRRRDDCSDSHSRLSLSASADQSVARHFPCFLRGRKGFFLLSGPVRESFVNDPLSSPSTEPACEVTQLQEKKSSCKQPAEVASLACVRFVLFCPTVF